MKRMYGRYGWMALVVAGLLMAVAPGFAAQTYTMKSGDTLWELAQRFYGDPTLYPVFLEVNRISNPRTIPTGKVLTIPNLNDMKKIANETDPAKRKALINSAQGGSSSTSGSTSGTTTPTTNRPDSSSSSSGPAEARSWSKILEGPSDPQSIKTLKKSDSEKTVSPE